MIYINYTVTHLHTMYGNGAFIDSVVRPDEYIDKAVEYGMDAIAFTEHGSIFSWYKKKMACEKAGLKYIHGCEFYATETLNEKIRDNFHVLLYAKNYDGFKELNKLSSLSYKRKQENRFYYNPRITLDELYSTSDNILISSACVGGILNKGSEEVQNKFIEFASNNSHRVFLEVQAHMSDVQREYNKKILSISHKNNIPIIAGTDTHCLDESATREILQMSKKIKFEDEGLWDLSFKSYDELVQAFKNQNILSGKEIDVALENTNVLANMVELFELDYSNKFIHISDTPEEDLRCRITEGLEYRGITDGRYDDRIEHEIDAYRENDAIEFILLEDKIKTWARESSVEYGPGRGSVAGSVVSYLMQVTDVDPVRYNLYFERFMSKERISLPDIDTDWSPTKRELAKQYAAELMGDGHYCEIITHNTIQLKGAIRDCGRALEIPLSEINHICKNIETDKGDLRKQYSQLFDYVDSLCGSIVSVGSHPAGIVMFDGDVDEMIGTFSTSENPHPISQIDMKEIDAQNYIKLDFLGLDTVELIAKTCEKVGIPYSDIYNIECDDQDVYNSIIPSSTCIFQFESKFAHQLYNKVFNKSTLEIIKSNNSNISGLDLMSMINGAIRPAGDSYRDKFCSGEFNYNGHEALDEFLKDTQGFLIYQEQIIGFLKQFCGYTGGEAEVARRGIAKKSGTEQLLPEIEKRFCNFMSEKYGGEPTDYYDICQSFLKVIEDASGYGFSLNHSQAYSILGYICAYLRHYYPLEFIASALDVYFDKTDKIAEITTYANENGIKIKPIKFGRYNSETKVDREKGIIYKSLESIKTFSSTIDDELFEFYKNKFEPVWSFGELILELIKSKITNKTQIKNLILLDYFSDFGNSRELHEIYEIYEKLKFGNVSKITKIDDEILFPYKDIMLEQCELVSPKTGKAYASPVIKSVSNLLSNLEKHIMSIKFDDYKVTQKVKKQEELLGHVSPTGTENDRRYIILSKVFVATSKDNGEVYGKSIIGQSIGSGKITRYTIVNKVLEKYGDVKEKDIIYLGKWHKSRGGYFYIDEFHKPPA